MSKLYSRLRTKLAAHPYPAVAFVYIISAVVHYLLILKNAVIPSIISDEILYYDLARSLADGAGLTVRGQSVFYPYIGYPLFLSPLFRLPASVNIYRAILLLNSASACAVCFPAFALTREITGRKTSAFAAACLSLILPDLFAAKHVMAESLLFPLFVTEAYALYRAIRKPAAGRAILPALLCACLYTIKPGYAAIGAAYALIGGYRYIRTKDRAGIRAVSVFLLTTACAVGLYLLALRFALRSDPDIPSLYAEQTGSLSFEHITRSLQGVFAYAGYLLLGFGLIPVIACMRRAASPGDAQGLFARILLAALVFTLAGTAYVIFYDEYIKSANVPTRIHLRYVSMYLVLFLPFVAEKEFAKRKSSGVFAFVWFLMLVCLVFFPNVFTVQKVCYMTDCPQLNLYLHTADEPVYGWLAAAAAAVLLGFSVRIAAKGCEKAVKNAFLIFFTVLMLAQSVRLYRNDRYAMDYSLLADAKEASAAVQDAGVYVTDDTYGYAGTALDISNRSGIPVTGMNALIDATDPSGAVISVTPEPMTGFIYSKPDRAFTPQYLIFEPDYLNSVVFASDAEERYTTSNARYLVLRLPESGRWIHSGLFGFNQRWVDSNSRFLLYDEALKESGKVRLRLQVRAGVPGAVLTLTSSAGETCSFTPTDSTDMEWISAEFTVPASDDAPFSVTMRNGNGNIYVETYRIGAAE